MLGKCCGRSKKSKQKQQFDLLESEAREEAAALELHLRNAEVRRLQAERLHKHQAETSPPDSVPRNSIATPAAAASTIPAAAEATSKVVVTVQPSPSPQPQQHHVQPIVLGVMQPLPVSDTDLAVIVRDSDDVQSATKVTTTSTSGGGDDDDVFTEGVGSPVKLAVNLGSPLPAWFVPHHKVVITVQQCTPPPSLTTVSGDENAVASPPQPLPPPLQYSSGNTDERSGGALITQVNGERENHSENDAPEVDVADEDVIVAMEAEDVPPPLPASNGGRSSDEENDQKICLVEKILEAATALGLNAAHPILVAGDDSEPGTAVCCGANTVSSMTAELKSMLQRLEGVTLRLEALVGSPTASLLQLAVSPTENQSTGRQTAEQDQLPYSSTSTQGAPVLSEVPPPPQPFEFECPKDADIVESVAVKVYRDLCTGTLSAYVAHAQLLRGEVAEHANLVQQAFEAQLRFLEIAAVCRQPGADDVGALLQSTSDCIAAVQQYRQQHRTSPHFNHLSAISESIPALGWVAVSPTPAPYVKEMNDAGQFYTNRVLKEWKEQGREHVDWAKSWLQTLAELQAFVKQYHCTGLKWTGDSSVTDFVPTQSLQVDSTLSPPPPPMMIGKDLPVNDDFGATNNHSSLFAQINQGEAISRPLKEVTSDIQSHENPDLCQGSAPFKESAAVRVASKMSFSAASDKSPVFVRDGKKWIIEYQQSNPELIIEGGEMNNVVYVYKCTDSKVFAKGKLNSITVDSCKKTCVVFDSLVSSIEFINCKAVQMQVMGKVPTISIDKSDGCQVYLSIDALDVEIVTSKSSEMNIMVPVGSDDYVEYPIPEQFKTRVELGKGLHTVVLENSMDKRHSKTI